MLGIFELTLLFANTTIGSYFVIFPWAFVTAGPLVCTVAIILVLVLYNLAGRMVLEQLSRGESLQRLKEEGYPLPKQNALIDIEIRPDITDNRTFQLFQLTDMFLGQSFGFILKALYFSGVQVYMISVITYFAVTFAAYLPIFETCDMYEDPESCWPTYATYVLGYAIIALITTLLRLQSSKVLTIFTTVCLFGVISLITITSIIALLAQEPLAQTEISHIEESSEAKNFSAIMAIFDATCIFYAIPYAVSESKIRDKRTLQRVIFLGIGVCLSIQLLLGYLAGSALSEAPQVCTIAWIGYKFPWESSQTVVSLVIEKLVLLMPAAATLVNGPLFAMTLASNFVDRYPRIKLTWWSLIVWVCPIAGALLIYEQSLIVSLSAIGVIYITFINTGRIQIASRRMIFWKSEYEGIHSSIYLAYGMILFGTILIVALISSIVLGRIN